MRRTDLDPATAESATGSCYGTGFTGHGTISVANLVLIAVMVVIFGAALLLPFPGRRRPGWRNDPIGSGAGRRRRDAAEKAHQTASIGR